MTRIIFTIAITTAIGFFIGKYFYSSYRDRRLYYSALTDFVSTLSNNLSFKQEKLSDVVLSYKQKTNKIFAEQLENFSNYISNGGSFSITKQSFGIAEHDMSRFTIAGYIGRINAKASMEPGHVLVNTIPIQARR